MAFARFTVILDNEVSVYLGAPVAGTPSNEETPGPSSGNTTTGLGELLLAMRSDSKTERESAWAACYEGYREVVWSRVFYVLRTVPWLRESREVVEDVTSDVFVGLVEAAKQYREEGKPERWLARVAVRAALRAREKLTGEWNGRHGVALGRRTVSFEDEANVIANELEAVDRDELLELDRRIAELRSSPELRHRRWAEFIDLYREGYGYEEIGKRLSLTEATARNWLVAIRKHLANSTRASHG